MTRIRQSLKSASKKAIRINQAEKLKTVTTGMFLMSKHIKEFILTGQRPLINDDTQFVVDYIEKLRKENECLRKKDNRSVYNSQFFG